MHNLKPNTEYVIRTIEFACRKDVPESQICDTISETLRGLVFHSDAIDDWSYKYDEERVVKTSSDPQEGELFHTPPTECPPTQTKYYQYDRFETIPAEFGYHQKRVFQEANYRLSELPWYKGLCLENFPSEEKCEHHFEVAVFEVIATTGILDWTRKIR